MKKGASLKDDFFDPASLALEDETDESSDEASASARVISLEDIGTINPGALEVDSEADSRHRLQDQFQDPLAEIAGAVTGGGEADAASVALPGLQGLGDVEKLSDSVLEHTEIVESAIDIKSDEPTHSKLIRPATPVPPAPPARASAKPAINPAALEWANAVSPAEPIAFESAAPAGDYAARTELYEDLFGYVLCDLPFRALVKACLEAIAKAVGAESASVLEADRERQDFFFRASFGPGSEKLQSVRIPQGTGFAGEVAASLQAELVPDVASDERFRRSVSAMAGTSVTNAMAAPIVIGAELFGVVEVFNKHGGQAFTEFDLATLERGAAVLGKVLEVRFFSARLVKRG